MENSHNKNSYKNFYEQNFSTNIIQFGQVVSVNDKKGLGRIKVRIKGGKSVGGDDGVLDKDLPWAFPMLPKHLSTQPKVKEAVFIFTLGKNKEHVDRLYIGPIISQVNNLDYDPFYTSALAGFSFGSQEPKTAVETIPSLNGVFPKEGEISIQGRYNTDITQKRDEIVIRAGKFVKSKPDEANPFPFKFNKLTQGYIQIKNNVNITNNPESFTNIVSNKINLLTHDAGSPRFNLTNQDNLISDEELKKIIETAHPLAFGDILLEYLIILKNAIQNHVHNGNGNKGTDTTDAAMRTLREKAGDLEKRMLSKNIRIN